VLRLRKTLQVELKALQADPGITFRIRHQRSEETLTVSRHVSGSWPDVRAAR
jgi:hypothetical protein